jgi:hypothetical protein
LWATHDVALATLRCYARRHDYRLFIVDLTHDPAVKSECSQYSEKVCVTLRQAHVIFADAFFPALVRDGRVHACAHTSGMVVGTRCRCGRR